MASAQRRSATRGRPKPLRCVLICTGSSGESTAHSSSEIRYPIVVRLLGVRSRFRCCIFSLIPLLVSRFVRREGCSLVREPRLAFACAHGNWERRDEGQILSEPEPGRDAKERERSRFASRSVVLV